MGIEPGTTLGPYSVTAKIGEGGTGAAFAAFARTGDPDHELLPTWPGFTLEQRATMIVENQPRVVNEPTGEDASR